MNPSALLRKRLPCVALALAAMAGIAGGRSFHFPSEAMAAVAAVSLLLALRWRPFLWLGVAACFATLQCWQYRESAAARLADSLTESPQVCRATLAVEEKPDPMQTGNRWRFVARVDGLEIGDDAFAARARVLVIWSGDPPRYGDVLRVRGSINNIPPTRNPGAFDHARHLANEGIRSELEVWTGGELLRHQPNPLLDFAHRARRGIDHTLSLGIAGTPEASLIRAMTIGDVSGASDALQDAFRETGTYHLFSVSGLHVGIVAVILWSVFAMTGLERRRIVLLLIPCLFFYVLITGFKPAGIRAATMLSIIAAGLTLDRPPTPLNSLGAAALVILLFDTNTLFNPGFQLSFLVVTAILLLAVPTFQRLEPFFQTDPFLPRQLVPPLARIGRSFSRWMLGLFAVSFAAWLGSLPLTLAYFHLVSFVSIPANLLAVPIAFVILALAFGSILASTASLWLADVLNHTSFLFAHLLIFIVTAFSEIPGAYRYIAWPDANRARVTVLDAGRGGATVIEAGGKCWLVDTGSEFFADSVTLPFLRSRGINRLDGLVLTHGDASHIGGFQRIADAMRPRVILDSGLADRSRTRREILARCQRDHLPLHVASQGEKFAMGAARLAVLAPAPDSHGTYADDKAVVLRFETGEFSMLLLSDAGAATLASLRKSSPAQLASDIVVVGRHVSGVLPNAGFLAASAPEAIISTSAPFPAFEQIPERWIQSVVPHDTRIFSMEQCGAVSVTVDRDSFTIHSHLSRPVETYALER